MRIFHIKPDRTLFERGYGGYVDAASIWTLPGIKCPICGAWGAIGVEYPIVDLSQYPFETEYRKARPEPPDEYERLRSQLAKVVPLGLRLTPGAAFGPPQGKAWGKLLDFTLGVPWTLRMVEVSAVRLANAGVKLPPYVPAQLQFRAKTLPTVIEFQLGFGPELLFPEALPPACSICGRQPVHLPDRIIIRSEGIPNDVDVFRAGNFATILLTTERFVQGVNSLGLLGAVFQEVEVTD